MEITNKITIETKNVTNIEIDKLNEDVFNLVRIYLDGIGVDYECNGERILLTDDKGELLISSPMFHGVPF